MTRSFFIAGTGTGVGKTLVTTSLCWQSRGKKIAAVKPIVSGYDAKDDHSDPALILAGLGLPATAENVEKISPWRFAAPLAPGLAAAKEKKRIDLDEVAAFCRRQQADIILVEGAGGVMSPLSESETNLDLMKALKWPVVLVAGNYLGAVSHALTAAQAVRNANLMLCAVIVSDAGDSEVSPADTAAMIKNFIQDSISVIILPKLISPRERWKDAPNIHGVIDG